MKLRAELRVRNDDVIQARKSLGFTQKHLSLICGMTIEQVANIEKLDFSHSDIRRHAERVAGALDLPVDLVAPEDVIGKTLTMDTSKVVDASPHQIVAYAKAGRSILPSPSDLAETNDLIENAIHKSGLTLREKQVLKLRFGLDGESPYTLEEVGRIFKVTRERVRMVEAAALTKISRRAHLADRLRPPEPKCIQSTFDDARPQRKKCTVRADTL